VIGFVHHPGRLPSAHRAKPGFHVLAGQLTDIDTAYARGPAKEGEAGIWARILRDQGKALKKRRQIGTAGCRGLPMRLELGRRGQHQVGDGDIIVQASEASSRALIVEANPCVLHGLLLTAPESDTD
jgi:hypothetical protein